MTSFPTPLPRSAPCTSGYVGVTCSLCDHGFYRLADTVGGSTVVGGGLVPPGPAAALTGSLTSRRPPPLPIPPCALALFFTPGMRLAYVSVN